MKIYKLFIVALVVLSTSSCSSDDNSNSSINFSGNWVHKQTLDQEADGEITYTWNIEGCALYDVTSFGSNSSYSETAHSEDNNGNCILSFTQTGSYTSLGNDTYRLDSTDDSSGLTEIEEFTVEYVDNNTLHLIFDKEINSWNRMYIYERQ